MTGVTEPEVAALLDLLGRRWTLRLIWELRGAPSTFNALRRRVGGMSQSVLVTRLTELYAAGLVDDVSRGYELTPRGVELADRLEPLREWVSTGRS